MIKNKKLIAYSALASAFLIPGIIQGQVVYTDIDPDIILTHNGETAFLDIDNNGEDDFSFLNASHTDYSYPFGYLFHELIWAGPHIMENSIAGTAVSFSSFSRYYPYALMNETLINSGLLFNTWGYQRMAFRTFDADDFDLNFQGGAWLFNVEGHYLGIHFIDDDENYHYGWIRCSVLDTGRTLIIKDYAYELQADHGILAGDTVSYVSVPESTQTLHATVYSYAKNVYVQLPSGITNAEIKILDVTGRIIYSNLSSGLTNVISLEGYAAGIYVVEVVQGDTKMVKKVFVE